VKRNARQSPVIRYRPTNRGMAGLWQTPVTATLIIINVAAFIAEQAIPSLELRGAMAGGPVYFNDQWYRLVTSMFLHINILHIGMNMLSLYWIGRVVEPALGRWRYLGLYMVSGFGGSVACYLFVQPYVASLGASGAIFGLLGAYFMLARRARADTSGIMVVIGINLVYSFAVPGISWQAHIGGLVTGAILAAVFGLARHRKQVVPVSLAALSLTTVGLIALLIAFLPAQFA
jgi:membrane associated rhomboid family serine protease